jgi:sensor histidine kinase regulating citrate/malate metabolism
VRSDSVIVKIADNGPGIPDELKDDVFGKGESGFESSGTGIGLYLVNRLVTGYGGDIWVEDNAPTGAIFVAELPKAD